MTERGSIEIVAGIALADRVRDTTIIEEAIEAHISNMEVLVGLWDQAATDEDATYDLEKRTGLTRRQISRWRTTPNDDRRRNKFASDLLVTAYASVIGLTRCQAMAELHRIGNNRAIAAERRKA